MAGIGEASSIIAVVSLAIQFGDSIKKFCDFWDSIQEAPREVRIISGDLSIVSDVLEDIRQEAESSRPYSRSLSTSLAALKQCADSLETLQELIDGLEPGFSSQEWKRRKWTAFKTAWKGEKIRRFQDGLRDMKLTLILARQNSNRFELGPSFSYLLMEAVEQLLHIMNHITMISASLHKEWDFFSKSNLRRLSQLFRPSPWMWDPISMP